MADHRPKSCSSRDAGAFLGDHNFSADLEEALWRQGREFFWVTALKSSYDGEYISIRSDT